MAIERYSFEKKVEVVQKFNQLGNMRLVSELTKVPYDTLMEWKRSEWWGTLLEELRQLKKVKTAEKMEEIIGMSLEAVRDRLENGDYILNNKTGEINRKPVSLRDAAQVTNNLITRQLQMEELAQKLNNKQNSLKETLQVLAKEFAKFTREQAKQGAVTIDYKEVQQVSNTEDIGRVHSKERPQEFENVTVQIMQEDTSTAEKTS